MAIAWSDVTAVAPELTSTASATQTYILDLVNNRMVDDDIWLDFANDGRAYLAAHIATLANGGAGSGAVTAEGLGPLTRSYATNTKDTDLTTTKYGRFYQVLLRMAIAVPAVVP